MPQAIEQEVTQLRKKIDDAKVRLGVARESKTKILADLRRFKITSLDQARARLPELKVEADKLDSEASTLLSRARKLLERLE